MNQVKAKELMVPLADYATVSEDATLYDAVIALEETRKKFDPSLDKHRAILVLDKANHIVGKLSQLDVIRGLEPKYEKIADFKSSSRFGFTAEFLKSLHKDYDLWNKPMDDICRKAGSIKVKDIMYTPTEGEYVGEEDPLDQAIHQLVIGHHQSLLVTRGREITGILRLTDVFQEVCKAVKQCGTG